MGAALSAQVSSFPPPARAKSLRAGFPAEVRVRHMTKQTSWESVVLDKRVEECAEFDLEILQHLTPGVAKKAALAKLTQETLKQLTDRKNMVRFNYADIITMLSMGTKVSQKLEGKPKAALLLITIPKTKGLAEVDKIGERLTEKLPEETDVCWAARTSPNASRTSVT